MASPLKSRRRQWPAVLLWALILAVLSLVPSSRLPKINSWSELIAADKFAHALVYAIFAVLLYQVLENSRNAPKIVTVVTAALYGVLMEFLQHFSSTGRAYELADMAANTIGALMGMAAVDWWEKDRQKIK